jgi:hypothetical protein
VLAGNAPDAERALEVVQASEAATECQVNEVIGDCAYGAGETRAEFAATGRTIVAKVPAYPQPGVVRQDRVSARSGGSNVHLPDRPDDRRSATGQRWRRHVRVCHGHMCGVSSAWPRRWRT